MVQMKEFRIAMPMSLEEYQVAQMYMVMKMQQQNTSSKEGVEVLENRPFEDDVFGKGQYTSKVYHLQSKAPSWLATFAPADALVMQEEAWNAYPRCKTVIKCPYFSKFSLTIETIHKADRGDSENVHCLSEEEVTATEVEFLDISSAGSDYWNYVVGRSTLDFSEFKSAKTGRGPLLEGWEEKCQPVMTAYKLVKVDAPYWGFGYRLEQALLAAEGALFLESHRNCFGWIDEWFGMTIQRLRRLEQQIDRSLNELRAAMHTEDLDNSSDIESNWADLDDEEEDCWASACNSQWQVRTVKSKAYWNDELGMAKVIEKKGKMWVTTGIVRDGKIYCTAEETLFLVQVGALLLVDVNDHTLSLEEIYDKLEKGNSDFSVEIFNVYRHLKLLGFVVARYNTGWSTKGQTVTDLFNKLQLVELVPNFDVYSPNSKFKKTAPGDPDFTIYVSRGPPPSIAEIKVLEKQCRGSSLIICHSENGRLSFFSYGKEGLPDLP